MQPGQTQVDESQEPTGPPPRRKSVGKGLAALIAVLLLIAIVALAWPRGPAGFTGVKVLAGSTVDWRVSYRVNTASGLGEITTVEDSGNRDIPVACREGNKLQVELDVFGGDTATVEIWSNGQTRTRFTSSPTGGQVGVAEC